MTTVHERGINLQLVNALKILKNSHNLKTLTKKSDEMKMMTNRVINQWISQDKRRQQIKNYRTNIRKALNLKKRILSANKLNQIFDINNSLLNSNASYLKLFNFQRILNTRRKFIASKPYYNWIRGDPKRSRQLGKIALNL